MMALYFYQAFNKSGEKKSGYLDAPSTQNIREMLAKQGLYPVIIKPASEGQREPFFKRIFSSGISFKEKILFTKQLSILLKAGVPLLQALELLTEQFEGATRSMLISIKDEIKGGATFADSLKKYSKTFDAIYVQLVRAGEASGKLDTILERLTNYLERREEVSKKVKGALRYPMIQLGFAFAVVIGLMAFVVPKMANTFKTQKQELPGATKVLMAMSDAVVNHGLLLLLFFGALIGGFIYWKSTLAGRRTMDRLLLKLPLIKFFTKTNAVVQFSYTLGMLLEGGVNLAESLDIVCNVVDNSILVDALKEARDKIIKQGKIAQYLKQTEVFPPIAIYLIGTGEQSGQLDSMLLTVAATYEKELEELADTLTESLGPILLIFMAAIVGFIVMAIAMPILKMSQAVGI
jgi:type II secretory pathway component PulF